MVLCFYELFLWIFDENMWIILVNKFKKVFGAEARFFVRPRKLQVIYVMLVNVGFFFVFSGKPPPHIEWRMGEELVSGKEPVLRQSGGVLAKKLKLSQLRREHHGANLTCLAFNSNLTEPLSESLRLVLYCTFVTFLYIY